MSNNLSMIERRDVSCAIRSEKRVAVRINVENDNSTRILSGDLRHLSRSALKLVLSDGLAPGTPVSLTIEVDSMGVVFTGNATVQWTQVRADGQFWMGCALEERMRESLPEQLAVEGYLERREDLRAHLSHSVAVHRELRKGIVAARIANLSPKGCCLLLADSVRKDERLLLEIEHAENSTDPVPVLVKWHRQNGDECLAGCVFLDGDGFSSMKACLPDQSRKTRKRFRWPLVAAAVLALGLVSVITCSQLMK